MPDKERFIYFLFDLSFENAEEHLTEEDPSLTETIKENCLQFVNNSTLMYLQGRDPTSVSFSLVQPTNCAKDFPWIRLVNTKNLKTARQEVSSVLGDAKYTNDRDGTKGVGCLESALMSLIRNRRRIQGESIKSNCSFTEGDSTNDLIIYIAHEDSSVYMTSKSNLQLIEKIKGTFEMAMESDVDIRFVSLVQDALTVRGGEESMNLDLGSSFLGFSLMLADHFNTELIRLKNNPDKIRDFFRNLITERIKPTPATLHFSSSSTKINCQLTKEIIPLCADKISLKERTIDLTKRKIRSNSEESISLEIVCQSPRASINQSWIHGTPKVVQGIKVDLGIFQSLANHLKQEETILIVKRKMCQDFTFKFYLMYPSKEGKGFLMNRLTTRDDLFQRSHLSDTTESCDDEIENAKETVKELLASVETKEFSPMDFDSNMHSLISNTMRNLDQDKFDIHMAKPHTTAQNIVQQICYPNSSEISQMKNQLAMMHPKKSIQKASKKTSLKTTNISSRMESEVVKKPKAKRQLLKSTFLRN